jgi:SET domain-containing protein
MKSDFQKFLEEIGVTEAQMADARIGLDYDPSIADDLFYIKNSRIEGYGAFSLQNFKAGEVIADGMKGKRWTSLGRFAKHSRIGNMRAQRTNNGFCFVAERAIRENEELTVNYRTVKAALTKEDK